MGKTSTFSVRLACAYKLIFCFNMQQSASNYNEKTVETARLLEEEGEPFQVFLMQCILICPVVNHEEPNIRALRIVIQYRVKRNFWAALPQVTKDS